MLELDIEKVKAMVDYNPLSGVFVWKPRAQSSFHGANRSASWNTRYAGKEAGFMSSKGYRRITLGYTVIPAHRVAWAVYYGEWPTVEIDHINRNKFDNRIENLRLATSSQNKWNTPLRKDNKWGAKGVSWCKSKNKYRANAKLKDRHVSIGLFDTVFEAAEAYEKFVKTHFKEFANPERRSS